MTGNSRIADYRDRYGMQKRRRTRGDRGIPCGCFFVIALVSVDESGEIFLSWSTVGLPRT